MNEHDFNRIAKALAPKVVERTKDGLLMTIPSGIITRSQISKLEEIAGQYSYLIQAAQTGLIIEIW